MIELYLVMGYAQSSIAGRAHLVCAGGFYAITLIGIRRKRWAGRAVGLADRASLPWLPAIRDAETLLRNWAVVLL